MNWKFFIGKTIDAADRQLLRSGISFVHRHYPYGRHWIFDLKRIFPGSPTLIIDAGANVGSITNELNYWFSEASIYAFEPIQSTYNQLVKNTKKQENIHPVNLALGSANERFTISLSSEHTINSMKVALADHPIGTEEISVVRLDHFLKDKSNRHVDILKIDVEGFEFEVLDGCGNLEIDVILLEVGYQREPAKVYFTEVDNYMEQKGYQLCGIYELMRNFADKRTISYSNNLYIRKEMLGKF
ncbi:methyltransferase, FkbM family [compost metagenome]